MLFVIAFFYGFYKNFFPFWLQDVYLFIIITISSIIFLYYIII